MTGHAYTAAGVRAPATSHPRREPPRAAAALAVAVACAVAMTLVYLVFANLHGAQTRDSSLLHHFTTLDRLWIETWGNHALHLLEPLRFILWGFAIVCFALARGRPRLALAVAVVLTCAPLTADILKPLLAYPHVRVDHVRVGSASWPSGHATAALTLVLCALMVVPARWRRPLAWVGGAYVVAVGLALLILAWHMPSDVLGGYLLATLWAALAVAALRAGERRWPTRAGCPGAVRAVSRRGAPCPIRARRAPTAARMSRPDPRSRG
jgi:membrane-associated phospholipid phosphatase